MRFSDFGKRVVFAAFDGGEITSDAGVLLLREQACCSARRLDAHRRADLLRSLNSRGSNFGPKITSAAMPARMAGAAQQARIARFFCFSGGYCHVN